MTEPFYEEFNDISDERLFWDSETCGLHGMAVLFQYAEGDGPIHLYDIWKEPVEKTLALLKWYARHTVIGFNLVFDHFHVAKIFTVWSLLPRDWIPEEHIGEIALLEPLGQDGPCLKPANALDLLLYSRKGPFQSLMAREDIRIRRVPTVLADALAQELEERIEIDGIYFARSHDKDAPRWHVFDIKNKDGDINPDLKDVVLKFHPAGGLKFLAEYALHRTPKYHYKDVEPQWFPKELGYAPTAVAVSSPDKNWEVWAKKDGKRKLIGHAWPALIKNVIEHWATRDDARDYARDDIVYTRDLCEYFGNPEPGDNDSILACMVAVVRWHGFQIDIPGIKNLLRKARKVVKNAPCNVNKPKEVRAYLMECLDDIETLPIETTTKKAKVETISRYKVDGTEDCTKCNAEGVLADGRTCQRCEGIGVLHPVGKPSHFHGNHPAALRAYEILQVKVAKKEEELYRKLLKARKFHASFNVIGTLSTRMSGGDGLNAQGIKSTKEVRSMFPLAWESFILCGGDFDSFEVTLADAVYDDPELRKALIAGKKIHALFAMCLFPGVTYEEVLASAGTKNDMYTKGKQGVFAMIYGGDWTTLVKNLGIEPDIAKAAFETWNKWFPQSAKARERTFKAFCSMTQPGGIGKQVVWADPAEYIESFLGFRRYFTLENEIVRALFQLASRVPKEWREAKIKICRRDRVQFAAGAVSSALYGASFNIQGANQRAAANHEIQSPGGSITKSVQRAIWDLQPVGAHELVVANINVHDEILSATHPDYVDAVAEAVQETVESFRPKVPLIGMTWNKEMANWAEKKGGSITLRIRAPEMAAA